MADAAEAETADGGGDGGGGGGGDGGGGAAAERGEAEAVADDPDFAVVCSFLHTFGALVQLEPIAFPKLARLLLDTHEVPAQLSDLFAKLLRKAIRNFRPNVWEKCLIKFCHQSGHRQEAWEIERFGYKKSSVHVKIKILKCLLEYQFVCNNKFKTAVNKLENGTLRLNPVGRDDKGRCYWMHRDHRANVRLYREDQDEETWKLIASDRAGVVDVIAALKSGKSPEDSAPEPVLNEDSNSLGSPCDPTVGSETEVASKNGSSPLSSDKKSIDADAPPPNAEADKMDVDDSSSDVTTALKSVSKKEHKSKSNGERPRPSDNPPKSPETEGAKHSLDNQINDINKTKSIDAIDVSSESRDGSNRDSKCDDRTIEEKVILFKGEGNGAECESAPFYFSEEIVEEVMYVTGLGSGYDCATGNPAVETTSSRSENQNDTNDCEFRNSKEEEVEKNKVEKVSETIDHNVESVHERVDGNENISKTDPNSTEVDSKSDKETAEGADRDSDLKNRAAPLPVTKRFLQNIPKSDAVAEVSDSKSKLWSVDSMCGNATSESPPSVTENNSISESNATVLLNKNSLNDSNSKNDTENTANIPTSDTIESIDSVSIRFGNFSTADPYSDRNTSVDDKTSEKSEKVNEICTPKKFFFGQPGCLKLSPDISTLSPNNLNTVKDTVVNNIEVKFETRDKETNIVDKSDALILNKPVENDENRKVLSVEEALKNKNEDVNFLPPIKSEKENVPESDSLISNVNSDAYCEIPVVPEKSSIDSSEISENLTENKISNDIKMSVPSDESDSTVLRSTPSLIRQEKHIGDFDDSTPNELTDETETSVSHSIPSLIHQEKQKSESVDSSNEMTVETETSVSHSIPSLIHQEKQKSESVDSSNEMTVETETSVSHSIPSLIHQEKQKNDSVDSSNEMTVETETSVSHSIPSLIHHEKDKTESVDSSNEMTVETETSVSHSIPSLIHQEKQKSESVDSSNEMTVETETSVSHSIPSLIHQEKQKNDSVDSSNEMTVETESSITRSIPSLIHQEKCNVDSFDAISNATIVEIGSSLSHPIPCLINQEKHKADSVDPVPNEKIAETESASVSHSISSLIHQEKHKTETVDPTLNEMTANTEHSSVSHSIPSLIHHGKHKTESVDTPAEIESSSTKKIKLSATEVKVVESVVVDNQNLESVKCVEKESEEIVTDKIDSSKEYNLLKPDIEKKTDVFIDETNKRENLIDETDVHISNGTSKNDASVSEPMEDEAVMPEKNETRSDSDVCDNLNNDDPCISEKEEINTKITVVNRTTRSASLKKTELANDDLLKKDVECKEENHTDILVEEPSVKKGKLANTRKRTREDSGSMMSEEEDGKANKKSKLKQKKTNIAQRKKVEQKLEENLSSDDDAEESPAKVSKKAKGKTKSPQKVETKKDVSKKKRGSKSKEVNEDLILSKEDDPPIRQSRRIAQLKIKEEAQRRLMEEIALRELKEKHKKKNIKGKIDQDWKHSTDEHSSDNEIQLKGKGKHKKDKNWQKTPLKWNSSSGGNETDTEPGDEPEDDFDDPEDEDELVIKSDHEFSPESDVDDSEWTPVRRARTLKKDDDDGDVSGGCVYCGKQDHPEWILLCDSCDAGWHASCLKPVLFLVPEGEWFCPPCNHKSLINALEDQLGKHDEQVKNIELEDLNARELKEEVEKEDSSDSEFEESAGEKSDKSDDSEPSGSSDCSTTNSSDDEKIYRLRERRQLPISYRFKEYDQLISSAIKEEYKEDENSGAGNQGRGKDISTIIEAEKEEKKAQLQAAGGDEKEIAANLRKMAARARRKPRKLNSLEVLSDDGDDNSDEDFKEAGWSSSSSEAITSDPDGSSSSSHSSDSMPLRRPQRKTQITRNTRRIVDSPEKKKKSRRILDDDTTEGSNDEKESSPNKKSSDLPRNEDRKSSKKKKKSRSKKEGEDVEIGGDGRSKVKIKYGGLSDSSRSSHDWSPAHRTRQRKYNYMEMPNTESEEEAHKPSGKHMDSSDEYKGESDSASDTDSSGRNKGKLKEDDDSQDEYQQKMNAAAVSDILKGSLVPIVKLSDISPIKSDSNLQKDGNMDISNSSDLAKGENANHLEKRSSKNLTPVQMEREKKRKEKQDKLMEKEKRKEERIKKKEEKLQLKEQKAKEREEKKQARIANKEQKNKKMRSDFLGATSNLAVPIPIMNNVPRHAGPLGVPIGMGHPPIPFDNRGYPPRTMTQMMLEHSNIPPVQDYVTSPNSSKLQEQMMYRSQMNSMSPHMRHSESPNIDPGSYPEDRKGVPIDHRLQMYPGKLPGISGPRPNLIGQRIYPPDVENPNRHMPPGYNPGSSGPIPEEMHIRPILNPAANHNMPRNGVPITDMTMNNPNLSRHLSPNPIGVSPGLESGPMVGPRGSTPKRRGRGPGKKTLARQAAAAGTGSTGNLSDGSSPGPIPSNSPLPEGTLTVAGAPQPFRPIVDPPSIITRMPHMMPPPYRGSSMYGNNSPMYGPPRGVSPNIPMPGAYRPHPPHPLDPSPSGGGPISMASPGRLSPHGHPYPYQSPSYYPPPSTPPQLGPHGSPYAPPAGRFPPPHISAPQSISPASTNTQDSMEMDDKSKVFQDQSEQGQFLPCKPDIKQEPESLSIKQSTSPTEELEDTPASDDQPETSDEPSSVGAVITPPPRVHPQLKHAESKIEKISRARIAHTVAARYPQGPYAPQYGPYGPYPAPPASDIPYIHPMHVMHPIQSPQGLTPIHRPPIPNPHHIAPVQILQRPPLIPVDHLRPEISIPPPQNPPSIPPTAMQNEEEAGEFGGLVSYFSSQQEDDIDA